jgi:hypothetical protein
MPITDPTLKRLPAGPSGYYRDERKMFAPQISEIVTYVEQLKAIDTSAVEPALGA